MIKKKRTKFYAYWVSVSIGLVLTFFSAISAQDIDNIESKTEAVFRIQNKLASETIDAASEFRLEKELFYIYINDDTDKALESALRSIYLGKQANLKGDVANSFLDLGTAYLKQSKFELAFESFSDALQYLKDNNLRTSSTLANFNIGVMYLELYLLENAKELLVNAEQEFENARDKSLATYELTRLYLLEGDTALANVYLERFVHSIPEVDGEINKDYLFHYAVLSELYIRLGLFEKAEAILTRTLPHIEKHDRRYYKGITSLSLARIAQKNGDLLFSIEHALKALELFQLQKENFYITKALLLLSELYSSNKNTELSLRFLSEYKLNRDSFIKAQQSAIQNRLTDQINATVEAKAQLQNTKDALENRQVYLAILLFLFIVAVALATWSFSLFKQKANTAEKIKDINAQKDHFIGIVSHDLRSPLNSIMAISSLLMEDADEIKPESIKEYSTILVSASQRMEHLINNMLDSNKIETGNAKLDIQPISIHQTILDLYNSSIILGNEKRISIDLELEENLPQILADSNALYRILENLLSNAFKFSEKDTIVTISVITISNQVQISITDQGPGLSDLDKRKLFQKFQKLSATPTANEKSTGLGLFIVKYLVKEMNGTILVESELGKGTSFKILFNKA